MGKVSVFLYIVAMFVAAAAQILLKISAGKPYPSRIREFLNVYVVTAYAMFFFSLLVTLYAIRFIPLSMGAILESTGYIFVSIMGYFILKEKLSRRKFVGILVIILGIVVFATGGTIS